MQNNQEEQLIKHIKLLYDSGVFIDLQKKLARHSTKASFDLDKKYIGKLGSSLPKLRSLQTGLTIVAEYGASLEREPISGLDIQVYDKFIRLNYKAMKYIVAAVNSSI